VVSACLQSVARRATGIGLVSLTALVLFSAPTVRADRFDEYELTRTFTVPAGTHVIDVAPDGRVYALVGSELFRETVAASGSFTSLGTLPGADIPSFGAAFIRVSPDNSQVAVGNNGGVGGGNFRVGAFDLPALTGSWFAAAHFDGSCMWLDNDRLAITAGDFVDPSFVSVLDVTSADPEAPDNPVVVDGIMGGSSGVTIGVGGHLFTGNGFSFGDPTDTGNIRAIPSEAWMAALLGGGAAGFEADGTLVADLLSGASLCFDIEGNLLVGGGDGDMDGDAVALVRAGAVADALGGGGAVDPDDPSVVRKLDPEPANDFNFFAIDHNLGTEELYVRDFGATTVYVYGAATNVPAASVWGLIVMGLLTLTAASLVFGGSVCDRTRAKA